MGNSKWCAGTGGTMKKESSGFMNDKRCDKDQV